jgi:16S rRNA (adenine1518-N6/adenine1519-N6)-dimethyltransferase
LTVVDFYEVCFSWHPRGVAAGVVPVKKSGRAAASRGRQSTASEVRQLLRRYHLKPDRRRGQNFLVADEVYDDIIGAAALTPTATVLEVGAGLGTLTARLAERAGRVVAVEVDTRLAPLLQQRFATRANVTVVAADILRRPPAHLGLEPPYQVVANIPYYLTSALLKLLLTGRPQPTSLTLLVQREVAARIVAAPGSMSLLALSVQLYGQPRLVRTISPDAFLPPPAVSSALLTVGDVRPFPFDVPERRFWQVARIGFAAKRKQLVNNLTGGLQLPRATVAAALQVAGLAATVRAEDLSPVAWRALVRALPPPALVPSRR